MRKPASAGVQDRPARRALERWDLLPHIDSDDPLTVSHAQRMMIKNAPGSEDFNSVVWNADGSTTMVIRHIRMDVDSWDELDHSGRESSVWRPLDNGAPTTGTNAQDEPDFEATNALGFTVIAAHAHIRPARFENTGALIFRLGYNYDESPTRRTSAIPS